MDELGIFPISEVMFARKQSPALNTSYKWVLFDIYKIAAGWPLQISRFAYIFNENNKANSELTPHRDNQLILSDKFVRKSTRLDLKGLALDCGLVVSA